MDPFDPDQLDLPTLVRDLVSDLDMRTTEGYVVGRTKIRDAVARRLRCSQLMSEQLVDTLVAQGHAYFVRDPEATTPGYWVLEPKAASSSA
jgi:hypothetical protein